MKLADLLKSVNLLKALFVSVLMLMSTTIVFAQEQKYDLIIKNDGSKIEAVVQYVELDVVKYKNFNNLEGPTYSISKDDIATIMYANGTIDVFQKKQGFSAYGNYEHAKIVTCDMLKKDYQKAERMATIGDNLWMSGTVFSVVGAAIFVVPFFTVLNYTTEYALIGCGAFFMGIGINLIIPGAIVAGIGYGKMRRINNDMIEVCSLPLNKGAKYPVNLSFTSSGLALRF